MSAKGSSCCSSLDFPLCIFSSCLFQSRAPPFCFNTDRALNLDSTESTQIQVVHTGGFSRGENIGQPTSLKFEVVGLSRLPTTPPRLGMTLTAPAALSSSQPPGSEADRTVVRPS
ncbi:unnamed protein product [Linum trigynum]|uniref:Uncharacterized protein n=1 Tax=Linum trigynum TaxID=586398 RepID=A0AAV2FPZ8_9ROSI